jgi:hypothetical protein
MRTLVSLCCALSALLMLALVSAPPRAGAQMRGAIQTPAPTNADATTETTEAAEPDDPAPPPSAVPSAGQIIISEFRLHGPGGSTDEYVELYNNTDADINVATADGSSGFSVATALNQAAGTTLFVIPNGAVIPARGHYLGVNSAGYSLGSYAAGNATYTADTAPNVGLALFNTSNTANFSATTRLDAVGSTAEANTLYREGAGYPPLTFITGRQHAFVRDLSGGRPKDTQNNAADFLYVNTDGANDGAGARLGAPGPENAGSPVDHTAQFPVFPLDGSKGAAVSPNRERDLTADAANNSTFGTMTIRHRFTNNTGAAVTRLRYHVAIITGFPVQSADSADLRVRTSSDTSVGGVNDSATCASAGLSPPCTVTVRGTVLETPPNQTGGGGLNSSLSVAAVTTAPASSDGDDAAAGGEPPPSFSDSDADGVGAGGPPVASDTIGLDTPLANGGSIIVQFLFGVQKTGKFRFYVNVESLGPPTNLSFAGVQNNVSVSSVTGGGFTECYRDTYANTGTPLATIQAQCSQSVLIMSCRVTGASTLSVAAMGLRSEVFTNTGDSNNVTHTHNGVGWYFSNSYSWGFVPGGEAVTRGSCDTTNTGSNNRLCWHTGGNTINGGWRCGSTTSLNSSTAWERIVYQRAGTIQ